MAEGSSGEWRSLPHAVLLLLLLALAGCVSLRQWTQALETREVQSCLYTIGFPWPALILFRSVTATGGATVTQCHALR